MAAQPSVDDAFTFVAGLNTEGGYFITPKNSWKEGDNVTPSTDGSISRRKALDFEENYQLYPRGAFVSDIDLQAYAVETWSSVNGNGNIDFFVVQEGALLSFYKAASGTVSASKLATEINLKDYRCFGNPTSVGDNVITCANAYGKLIVTAIGIDPILLTYDEPTNTITVRKLELQIRDFAGIRSPVLPQSSLLLGEWQGLNFWPHALYNLYNQGWDDTKVTAYRAANADYYPANTQQWIFGKNNSGDFDASVLRKVDFGTSTAPKGRFIFTAFYQDRGKIISTMPGITPQVSVVPPTPNINDQYAYMETSTGGSGE
jgi:hypothetical protein